MAVQKPCWRRTIDPRPLCSCFVELAETTALLMANVSQSLAETAFEVLPRISSQFHKALALLALTLVPQPKHRVENIPETANLEPHLSR